MADDAALFRPTAISLIVRNNKVAPLLVPTSIQAKSPPSHRRQHAPRQRNPPPINRHARFACPRLRHPGNRLRHHHARLKHRRLNRQHPTHRTQNPRGLWSRLEQLHHFRLPENMSQLRAIIGCLIRRRPDQPTEPPRPNPRAGLGRNAHASRFPRRTQHQTPGLKPHRQTFNFPADVAQPPIQQQRQKIVQKPTHRPAAQLAAQGTQHRRQAQIRGNGRGGIHPQLTTR